MNTRTAYSRPEGKKVIDADTGEELTLTPTASTWADKNFMKIFTKNFRRTLKGVVNQKMQVALWILENMTPANEVRHTYKEIASDSKSSLQTVVRTVETLEKDNFLCRTMPVGLPLPSPMKKASSSLVPILRPNSLEM